MGASFKVSTDGFPVVLSLSTQGHLLALKSATNPSPDHVAGRGWESKLQFLSFSLFSLISIICSMLLLTERSISWEIDCPVREIEDQFTYVKQPPP